MLNATLPALAASGGEVLPEVGLGYIVKSFCHELLDDYAGARASLDDLLHLVPEHAEALGFRGMLRFKSDEVGAMSDFERAVALRCDQVGPYYFVARQRMQVAEYHQALSLCARVLQLTRRPNVQALMLQWAAIAQHALGYSVEIARATFRRSKELDPSNPTIDKNMAIFEGAVDAGRAIDPADWSDAVLSSNLSHMKLDPMELLPHYATGSR